LNEGGEGIILRNPTAVYEQGRSRSYLKLKTARDAEAKIVARVAPNMWECMLPNGVIFTAPPGTLDFTVRWQPKFGDIVTFKHRGFMLRSKKPKWPTLSRLRADMTWENVVAYFEEKQPKRRARLFTFPVKRQVAKGHWKSRENRRKHLCEFAARLGFDPLVAENWEKLKRKQLLPMQGMRHRFNGSYRRTIADAFPELKWSQTRHASKRHH